MLNKVLIAVEARLLQCFGEGAYQNYDLVLPWKQASGPNIWARFVQRVIMPYLKRGLGEVRDNQPVGGMAAMDARVDHLMRWCLRCSPRTCLTSYRVSSLDIIGRVLCAGGSSW